MNSPLQHDPLEASDSPLEKPAPPSHSRWSARPLVWGLSTGTHGILDYVAVVWLAVTPRVFAFGDMSTSASLGISLAILLLAVTTHYPLGLLKVLPLSLHLLVDYALCALLILAPRTFGLSPQDPGGPMLHGAGLVLLIATLATHAGATLAAPRRGRSRVPIHA